MTQPYSIISSASTLNIRILSSMEALSRSIVFSNACFEFADKGPEGAQHGNLPNLSIYLTAILTAGRRFLFWSFSRRRLLSFSSCCYASFISDTTPRPAYQPCVPRGRLKRGVRSVAVESLTSVMSEPMSLIEIPSGFDGSAIIIALPTCHRRLGSLINRRRPVVLRVSLVLSLLRFAGDADFRVHMIILIQL